MYNHYDDIANKFDDNWLFSSEYRDWYTDKIIEYLDLYSDDLMIDIGCGTGIFTKSIIDNSYLSSATCIESSEKMCELVRKYKEINVICKDAEKYFMINRKTFNKVLFKEVLHHIADRNSLFKNINTSLSINGKIIIVTRPRDVSFPFFKKAHESFRDSQPDYNIFKNELINVGFNVDIFEESFKIKLKSDRWFKMLRDRFMSNLSHFTMQEIEDGIKEINQEQEFIFQDNLIFIVANKSK